MTISIFSFCRLFVQMGVLAFAATPASAEEALKVAIGQMDVWTNQATVLGAHAGIFKKHGVSVESFGTQGTGETLQAVISGAADLGIGMGTIGVMSAFAKGAPVRIIAASFTGGGDLYWYVRADSKILALADATANNTIAFSSVGSSTQNIVLAFGRELGTRAKPTQTGGQPGTLTQVMSGQVDIGWAVPPFGLKEVADGKIRIIAGGNDVPALRNQTVRVEVVNAKIWKERRAVMERFVQAYRESVDWMYSDPEPARIYAARMGTTEALVKVTLEKFEPRESKQVDRISGLDAIMADGVRTRFLEQPLTVAQLNELIVIPPRAPKAGRRQHPE
jgi:NitT/TauT family transport system substrate-binding protein